MLKLMRQWLKIRFKGQARLTFDLSAKVAHIGVPSTYLNIVFSETTRPMEIKFHMTTPYDWLAKGEVSYAPTHGFSSSFTW